MDLTDITSTAILYKEQPVKLENEKNQELLNNMTKIEYS